MLLNFDANAKTVKGQKKGWKTGILYLAPASISGVNVCSSSSEGCRAACLYTAGQGRYPRIQQARIAKTQKFLADKQAFLWQLYKEITLFEKRCAKDGFSPCIRLNGTSDIAWERLHIDGQTIFEMCPRVQFYDYTKHVHRMMADSSAQKYTNYHLTFSRSECNDYACFQVLEAGGNVAVVFDQLPETWAHHAVISGDENDLRFLDPKKTVIGLKAKGAAKKDQSGFVIYTQQKVKHE